MAFVPPVWAESNQFLTVSGVIPPFPPPVADFKADNTVGDAPLAVQFTDLSTGYPATWSWEFGDGGTSDAQNPVHIYSNPGKYTVRLRVTSPSGSDTKERPQYIHVTHPPPIKKPKADFSAHPQSGMVPLTVQFTDLSTGNPISWDWDFGDGGHSSDKNPSHTYTHPGVFMVRLKATNSAGSNTETKPHFIIVTSPPLKADFSGIPRTGIAPLTVQFTDLSTGNPSFWLWRFGDGDFSVSFDRSPMHKYRRAGLYTVKLTVMKFGDVNTETRKQYISVQ